MLQQMKDKIEKFFITYDKGNLQHFHVSYDCIFFDVKLKSPLYSFDLRRLRDIIHVVSVDIISVDFKTRKVSCMIHPTSFQQIKLVFFSKKEIELINNDAGVVDL